MAHPRSATRSTWSRLRAPQHALADGLRRRHHLWLHGWCIGSFMLAVMWGASHLQMRLGVQSLALRYLLTLGLGYLAYLLVLRLWAAWLLRRSGREQDHGPELPSPGGGDTSPTGSGSYSSNGTSDGISAPPLHSGGGGDFGGAGASGSWDAAGSGGAGDIASSALEAAASADEGAVVVVPVVLIFLAAASVLAGAGALAWLYFGSEVLLAVAVELAFSVATARALMGAERAGWLAAAWRLTRKPLLGALLCAVALGAALDRWVPEARSLPHAVQLLRAH